MRLTASFVGKERCEIVLDCNLDRLLKTQSRGLAGTYACGARHLLWTTNDWTTYILSKSLSDPEQQKQYDENETL